MIIREGLLGIRSSQKDVKSISLTVLCRIPCLCIQAPSSMQVNEKTDFSKLRVTQLKQLLKDRGESCPECVEKRDYVKRVRSLYVPDASGEL